MRPRVYLSAGEPSGDLHGARVAAALRALAPGAVLEGVGGSHMDAAGVRLIESIRPLGAIGLLEAAASLPAHALALHRARRRLTGARYEAAVLIDYPGFHLRLLPAAQRGGVPVLCYIAPQLWAWGETRAGQLRRARVTVATILPFEQAYFEARGIPARFVSHPLLDGPQPPSREVARAQLGLGRESPVLALAPGSRPVEIGRLWPIMRAAARRLRTERPELQVVVAGAGDHGYPDSADFMVRRNDTATVLAAADAALVKSGTVTLEAALANTPMIVTYALHPVTFAIARRVVQTPSVALVNLVAGREVTPEFLQDRATPERLAAGVAPLLIADGAPAHAQRAGFREVRKKLGTPGAARRVAEMALEVAQHRVLPADMKALSW